MRLELGGLWLCTSDTGLLHLGRSCHTGSVLQCFSKLPQLSCSWDRFVEDEWGLHVVQDQADGGCLSGVGIRGTQPPDRWACHLLSVAGEVGTSWRHLLPLEIAATTTKHCLVSRDGAALPWSIHCLALPWVHLEGDEALTCLGHPERWLLVVDTRCWGWTLMWWVKKAGSATYWWLGRDCLLLLADVPTAPRSSGWSGEGQGEQTDAVWRGKKNYTKCFFIVRLLPQRPRCYPALLRVKKGSVNKNSRAAGSIELIQLQAHS